MADIIQKFSKAIDELSADTPPSRARVYGAFNHHLSDIIVKDLPVDIHVVFEAVTDKLNSLDPAVDLGDDEAAHIARDIEYMAGIVKSRLNKNS